MSVAVHKHNALLANGLSGPVTMDTIFLEVVADILRECWQALCASMPALLRKEIEPNISMLIEGWLRGHGAASLDVADIVDVTRGSETTSGDGEHHELRPDLNLHIAKSRKDGRFPLKVEAKILDATRPIAKYGSAGIARFVSGDYAWGRREAMMVAYVRDDSHLPTTLADHLADPDIARRYGLLEPLVMEGQDARTRHKRPVIEIDGRPWVMGHIDLWHVWLRAPQLDVPK